jgi:hypothetical protein
MTVMTRIVAALVALAFVAPGSALRAQQAPDVQTVPTAQGFQSYDPNVFNLPKSDFDFGKSGPGKYQNDKSGIAAPNKFDLGQYSLRLGTTNGVADLAPKSSIDPGDGVARSTSRVSPLNKNFYGLTLTTPIR